ncbi:MAG: homogentisate 1,2-dioxygenase [Bradymonadia bacterium]
MEDSKYLSGFGNVLWSEAEPGALPMSQNAPKEVPYGLFAEQINGTGFTVHRAENRRVWLYRLRPQIPLVPWQPLAHSRFTGRFDEALATPQIMRFKPFEGEQGNDWLDGLTTFAGAGDPTQRAGSAVHLYAADRSMERAFTNIDGDLLVAPVQGTLTVRTEMGVLSVSPSEIVILPRGIRFQVELVDDRPSGVQATGYVAELFDGHFQLPERGPVGANGMADARHFMAPVAHYTDRPGPHTIVVKQGGRLWQATQDMDPFDVVAWHGNYAPFKYDLKQFNSLGSVSFDHPDPSILTVLTSPLDTHGRNAIDVGVFIGRWDPTEHTFRPPYFHRNSAIEFNGVIRSPATHGPWVTGAYSFTPYLTPHGVSATGHVKGTEADDAPARGSDDSIWLQFESAYLLKVMPWMMDHPTRDAEYLTQFEGWRTGSLAR